MREFDLLQHVYEASRAMPAHVRLGPGDDMAELRLAGRDLLVAVDQLVAGRHVRLDVTPLELVGRKAIARSVSDIAAMAGRPIAALVAVTLPPGFGAERATSLFEAMRAAGTALDTPLVGGDIATHGEDDHPLVCSVTVLAETGPGGSVTRAGARPGDVLCVTGALGGAWHADGGGPHLTFEPRVAEALDLRAHLGPRLHAMIDVSDGTGRDASHIAAASGVRIEIDAARLPCRAGSGWEGAMSDGEDYELLFTAAGTVPATVGAGVPVSIVGRVLPPGSGPGVSVRTPDGRTIDADDLGWEHA